MLLQEGLESLELVKVKQSIILLIATLISLRQKGANLMHKINDINIIEKQSFFIIFIYELAQKYLTLEYLKKIKYGDISKEKKQIENEINNVSFTNSVKETIDNILDNKTYNTINDYLPVITLNKAYRLYKTTIKFNQRISSFKKELEKTGNDFYTLLEGCLDCINNDE